MVTVADVKTYLKIPYSDDDTIIQNMIDAGNAYLCQAVDDYLAIYIQNTQFRQQVDDWILRFWMPKAYLEREGTGDGQLSYVARSALTQLQQYELEVSDDDDDE